ncbi:ankyrin repeat-containing domain protein [Mycena albidolilacea]|uniref:Ankyrin repeat-containing domain protein n=1 Tax=Mycena albidolilacea TaxID=1033008 RepID=A0AAD7AK64_9AGAR|nr:ankyrin repeat-containing domain protein [Mycena albidolilacea]
MYGEENMMAKGLARRKTTPLNYAYLGDALQASARAGKLEIPRYLITEGADINFLGDDSYGFTPLSYAAGAGNIGLVTERACIFCPEASKDVEMSLFLGRGVDPNLEDDFGETPLHRACSMRTPTSALVELLLQFGAATVEQPNINGHTPVHFVMDGNNWEVVKIREPLVQNPALRVGVNAWSRGNRTFLSSCFITADL